MARSKRKTKNRSKTSPKKGRITRPINTNNQVFYENLHRANLLDEPRRCRNILQAMIGYEIIKGVRRVRKYNNISTERFWKRTEDCVNSIDLRTIPEAPPHFYEYLHYLYLMKVGPSINKLSKNLRQKQMEEEVAGQLMSMKDS